MSFRWNITMPAQPCLLNSIDSLYPNSDKIFNPPSLFCSYLCIPTYIPCISRVRKRKETTNMECKSIKCCFINKLKSAQSLLLECKPIKCCFKRVKTAQSLLLDLLQQINFLRKKYKDEPFEILGGTV